MKNTVKKLLGFLGKSKAALMMSVLLAAASICLSLYVPILFGSAIDNILDSGVSFGPILEFLTRAGIVVVICAILQWAMGIINNRITFETVRRVRERAFEKLEHLPLKYIDSNAYGDLLSRVISDVDTLRTGF